MDLSRLAELSPETLAALQEFLQDTSLQQQMKKKIELFHEEIMRGEEENKRYSTLDYWEQRYQSNDEEAAQSSGGAPFYDWLVDHDILLPLWKELVRPEFKVLVVGCGNSQLTEKLFLEGFANLTCMDFSPHVIEQMITRWRTFLEAQDNLACRAELARLDSSAQQPADRIVTRVIPGVAWHVEDLRAMRYESGAFDVVFDKATLDALLTNRDHDAAGVPRALAEIERVIAPGGLYIWISWGESKTELLKRSPWGDKWDIVRTSKLSRGPGCLEFDVYVARKRPQ